VEGVQLLLMLDRKPPLPFVLAPPGMRQDVVPGRRPEAIPEQVIERIRALLHKAERTDFSVEAESFMAKAQELMALHSIERAMLDHADRDEPAAIRIYLDDPYAAAKLHLVAAVDDAVARVFPALGRAKVSLTNGAGWAAGRVAADRASLGTRASLSTSSPPTRASATGRRR
jgi:hypothetical protein